MSLDEDLMRSLVDVEKIGLPPMDRLTGIRVIALVLAMKQHDSSVVRDADMYRTLKGDGQVIVPSRGIDSVLEIADKIERHLMTEPKWLIAAAREVEKDTGVNPFPDDDPDMNRRRTKRRKKTDK